MRFGGRDRSKWGVGRVIFVGVLIPDGQAEEEVVVLG